MHIRSCIVTKQTGLIVSQCLNFAFKKGVGVSGARAFRLQRTWKQQVLLFSLGFFFIPLHLNGIHSGICALRHLHLVTLQNKISIFNL